MKKIIFTLVLFAAFSCDKIEDPITPVVGGAGKRTHKKGEKAKRIYISRERKNR